MTPNSLAGGAARLRRGLRLLDGGRESYYARVAAYYESRHGLYGKATAPIGVLARGRRQLRKS